ncbi:MAG TPA: class II fructose-bisphosphatase [Acidimicrobiia bacterium]|nr:class II fructose-bisphosphatase [Acidimicrobiia bacterium]
MPEIPDRNLGLDLARVTETAAMAAARWQGRGDKEAADKAAVDGMRAHLGTLDLDGVVVIGEGEKDEAPMLHNGERVGNGQGQEVDVAVDPVEGTTLVAYGMPGALAVLAVAERGAMFSPNSMVYMEKIAVGPEAKGAIDLDAPVERNLARVAKAKDSDVNDLTVIILDRPRNQTYIDQVRAAGARIRLIRDGDVSGAIATGRSGTGIDMLLGIGGSPEAVLAAAAMRCMGGEIQCRLWPRNDTDRAYAAEHGYDLREVMGTDALVGGTNVSFAATGITGGEFLQGVEYHGHSAITHSVMMRSKTGSIRYMDAFHDLELLSTLSSVEYG